MAYSHLLVYIYFVFLSIISNFVRLFSTFNTSVLAACAFLIVLGTLMVLRVWLPPTFEGIDPEQKVSERYRQHLVKDLTEINSKT